MRDQDKTKEQILSELEALRQQVAGMDGQAAVDGKAAVAEEERDRLQAILNAAIECLPFEFFALQPDGRYIYENALVRQRYGGGVGKRPEEYAPNEATRRLWLDNNRRAFAGERVEGEFEACIDGETRRYFNVVMPIQAADRCYGILGVNVDITERKRSEDALKKAHDELEQRIAERTAELTRANEHLQRGVAERRRAEEAHATTLERITDGFISIERQQWRCTYINQAAARFLRKDRDELLGRPAAEMFPEAVSSKFTTECMRALQENIPVHFEEFYPEPLNIWFECHFYPSPEGLTLYFRDVTERKRVEEALRQQRDQLQTIYDGITEGLLITDIESKRFLRANSSLCRMLGYSQEELLEASIPDIHPPEEVPNDLQRFQATAEGRVSISEDRPVLRKDSSIFRADITGHRISYNGRPCLLALFRDTTERKRAQRALEREHRTLKHMLRASDHERQLIAYDLHDGLTQQLAGAIMQFEIFDHLKSANPADAQKAYDGGIALVRQCHFEARRLISGVRPPILDEFGVVAAIAHLVNEQSLKGTPHVLFRSSVRFNRLAPVLENTIYRIVHEGLTNAEKHSKSEMVWVTMQQSGDNIRIEIRDRGVGCDLKTVQEHHFGLAGIRQRARLLGGKCRIQSKVDRGMRLVVDFPLAERETDG
jgi:PAS domain S-box-containing protein